MFAYHHLTRLYNKRAFVFVNTLFSSSIFHARALFQKYQRNLFENQLRVYPSLAQIDCRPNARVFLCVCVCVAKHELFVVAIIIDSGTDREAFKIAF